MDPERIAHNNTEDGHQAAVFCWAALPATQAKYPELRQLLFAIPNGGFRDKREAAKLKATGTKAGVSDIFLSVSRGGWHGLYIELKKFGGKPKPEQLEFIQAAKAQGYCGAIAVGWIQAVEYIEGYLNTGR
jgi:hypothetical protein